jgi:hypothetical protein
MCLIFVAFYTFLENAEKFTKYFGTFFQPLVGASIKHTKNVILKLLTAFFSYVCFSLSLVFFEQILVSIPAQKFSLHSLCGHPHD